MDSKNLTAVLPFWLVTGMASTATRRKTCPPFEDFGSLPIMLRPHWAKGQAMGMGRSSDPGACGLSVNRWHPLHLWTMSFASLMAVGQYNPARRALATRERLPAW